MENINRWKESTFVPKHSSDYHVVHMARVFSKDDMEDVFVMAHYGEDGKWYESESGERINTRNIYSWVNIERVYYTRSHLGD